MYAEIMTAKLDQLREQTESPVSTENRAKELVQRFLDSADTNRELLLSLIERIELTEDKQSIIKFRLLVQNARLM